MKELNFYSEFINDLIIKVRNSNQKAFEELLRNYDSLISSLINNSFTENMTKQDAEDLRQELVVVFYNSILSYDIDQKEVSFGLYTKICMKNALITHQRALNKRNDLVTLQGEDVLRHVGVVEESPDRRLIEDEEIDEINSKIQEVLSTFESKVWRLYASGFSSREIAIELKKNEKSIDNAIFRIRSKLKALFLK